jgi:hypothetical protein
MGTPFCNITSRLDCIAFDRVSLRKVLFIYTLHLFAMYIQDEHKITYQFQNYTENKCSILRNSHPRQLKE